MAFFHEGLGPFKNFKLKSFFFLSDIYGILTNEFGFEMATRLNENFNRTTSPQEISMLP